nr:hypothetical protein [Octadecabacter dasysiphoniae]
MIQLSLQTTSLEVARIKRDAIEKADDLYWSGVTDANSSVALGSSMAGGANIIAALSSFAGGDSAWARGNGSTASTFDVSVEEETSLNAETVHEAETVDYFAFSDAGVVSAYDYDFFV